MQWLCNRLSKKSTSGNPPWIVRLLIGEANLSVKVTVETNSQMGKKNKHCTVQL
ncbi:hypothetical protein HYC85_025042 [Camellia sinensis]|uniref:Uncharacterized protein n=1 Tax=Camellia sinensis TaxID=4442 RepID=A0A7J7GDY6_CAMSI|nr:hypothetical protein HYC85_025042 [Camellia sinensis]